MTIRNIFESHPPRQNVFSLWLGAPKPVFHAVGFCEFTHARGGQGFGDEFGQKSGQNRISVSAPIGR
jgi:hypothetical protein